MILQKNYMTKNKIVVTGGSGRFGSCLKKNTGKYHIIAGAFRIQENAEKKVEQLISEGYSARQIGQNKYGLHQVVYASYEDRLEALRSLRDIKRSQNKDAWLLVQELSK